MIEHITLEIVLEMILLAHLIEYLKFELFLLVHLRNVLQDFTDFWNIVGHYHASKGFNKDQN